ncbi:MAG: membrane protein [Candidatus Hydrogenedentota bacterium]
MARQKKQPEAEPGAPLWMVTYGDLMGLLLTFFILLLSFSVMDTKKISQALEYFKTGSFGVLPMSNSLIGPSNSGSRRDEGVPSTIEKAARQIKRRMQIMGREKEIGVEYDPKEGGLKISLPSHILFDVGRAELLPDASGFMGELAAIIAEVPQKFVEIRGHTDDQPIRSASNFRDNYDLSYERAKNVMLNLVQQSGVPQEEFEVVACGPSQPMADNATEEGRSANRRVELFIRGDFADETEQTIGTMIQEISAPRVVEETAEGTQEVTP